jgi:hypothetical protein
VAFGFIKYRGFRLPVESVFRAEENKEGITMICLPLHHGERQLEVLDDQRCAKEKKPSAFG